MTVPGLRATNDMTSKQRLSGHPRLTYCPFLIAPNSRGPLDNAAPADNGQGIASNPEEADVDADAVMAEDIGPDGQNLALELVPGLGGDLDGVQQRLAVDATLQAKDAIPDQCS